MEPIQAQSLLLVSNRLTVSVRFPSRWEDLGVLVQPLEDAFTDGDRARLVAFGQPERAQSALVVDLAVAVVDHLLAVDVIQGEGQDLALAQSESGAEWDAHL
ncbi:hypothetical protein GCM10010452_70730 [Crossiella cryophila]